jgi:hypothetical protein
MLRRLARTSPKEWRVRGRSAAAVAAESIRYTVGYERWRPDALQLRRLSLELRQAKTALAARRWNEAGAALRAHFLARAPRFVIDPAQRDRIAAAARARFPEAARDAVARGDRLVSGRYDLLAYRGLAFGGAGSVDWHLDPVHQRRAPTAFWARVPYLDPACGDHKVIWEINRHQHWLALGRAAWLTGERRYADRAIFELESWMRANPPLAGVNWSSMLELAFRSISWIWALHFFAPVRGAHESTWLVDLLTGIDRQLNHVARHLSYYFSPNTHLLGEALALYAGGRVLPELDSAAHWETIGRDILLREAHAQVHGDGGHAELSTHYHRYALDFYLLALAIARETADPAEPRFREVAMRLAVFCRALADDAGRLPLIGDDDGGMLFPICGREPADVRDTLGLAAALLNRPDLAMGAPPEEVFWMLGGNLPPTRAAQPAPAPSSRVFPETGYAVLRSARTQAIFDAGHHGFMNAGHAHADALAIVMSVDGRPLLIDPGTATYTMDSALRDRFRSTAMHNTVAIDGRPQSVPSGPFHWHTGADARLLLSHLSADFDCVEAEHRSYHPVVHRRMVVRDRDLWIVFDSVLGAGRHQAEVFWHLDPLWTRDDAVGSPAFVHADGGRAAIASTAQDRRDLIGDVDGIGWCSPIYGRVVPAPVVRFSQTGNLPMTLATAIAAGVRGPLSIRPCRVRAERADGWHRAAVEVILGEERILALCATPLDAQAARSLQDVAGESAEVATDARVAVVRLTQMGAPASINTIDSTVAECRSTQAGLVG